MWCALEQWAHVVGLPSGAGNITPEVIDYLSKFKSVHLAMDNDAAGQSAMLTLYRQLQWKTEVHTLSNQYRDHKDVADALHAGWKPVL